MATQVRLSSTLIALLLLAVVPSAFGGTGPAGFSAPLLVGSGLVYTPTGSVGPSGRATLAWSVQLYPPDTGPTVDVVVVRGTPLTGAWGPNEVVTQGAEQVRDVQVAEGDRTRTVVAWAELRRGLWQVLAAMAPPDRPFGRPQALAEVAVDLGAKRRGYAGATQLVATMSNRLVLVWQEARPDGIRPGPLRYALSVQGHDFGRSRSLTKSGAFPALVATSDGGVVAAWRVRGRLRAARLAPRARTFSPAYLISRSVAAGPRLASGPDGTVLASWSSRSRPYRLLTRRIRPLSRVRTLARTGRPVPAAAIAVGPKRSSIAAFWDPFSSTRPRVSAATSGVTGRWRAPEPLASQERVIAGRLRAVISTRGDGFVAWSQSVDQPGPIAYEVVVARHPRGSARFEAPTRLGAGPPTTYGTDRTGVVLDRGGGSILAAWSSPEPAGGMLVSTRPDR